MRTQQIQRRYSYCDKSDGWGWSDPMTFLVDVRPVVNEITFPQRRYWDGDNEVVYTPKAISAGTEVALVRQVKNGVGYSDLMIMRPAAALSGDWASADILVNLGKDETKLAEFIDKHFECGGAHD